jgi:hypothetical protein
MSKHPARHRQAGTPSRPRFQPGLEALEERCLLSAGDALAAAYGQLPLSFEANGGQSDAQVSFLAHGPHSALFLTQSGTAVLAIDPTATLPGAVRREAETLIHGAAKQKEVSGGAGRATLHLRCGRP